MGTLKTIRALMYWSKSVLVKEKGRKRKKKKDRDTERARDCPKRHANYGPSLPVSIPTPGESLAQLRLAQRRRTRRSLDKWRAGSGGAWWRRKVDTSKNKVGSAPGAHFFTCATYIISYTLRCQRHLKGVLRFFWSALYNHSLLR